MARCTVISMLNVSTHHTSRVWSIPPAYCFPVNFNFKYLNIMCRMFHLLLKLLPDV